MKLAAYFSYRWPCDRFDSDNRLRNRNRYILSSARNGSRYIFSSPWNGNRYLLSSPWKGNSMYILFNRRTNSLFNRFSDDPFHRLRNDLFNRLRDSSLNFFRNNLFRFAATFCIVKFRRHFCRTHFCSYKRRCRFALANRCCDIFRHRFNIGACFGLDRGGLRGFRFRRTHQGGLVKRWDAWQRCEG